MKNQPTHTPTPWRHYEGDIYDGQDRRIAVVAHPENGFDGTEAQHNANCEIIVRAVNAHEKLVAIAKKYKASLQLGNFDEREEIEKAIARAEGK